MAVAASGGLLLLRDPYYRAIYPQLAAPVTAADAALRAERLTAIESSPDPVRLVKLPHEGMNVYQVWYGDNTEAFVDARTGALLDRWDPLERFMPFHFELHAHHIAEPGGTLVNGWIALFLVFMALTGVILWWPARRGAFRLRRAVPIHHAPSVILRSHAAMGAIAAIPILIFASTGAAIVFYDEAEMAMTAVFDAHQAQEPNATVALRDAAKRPWTELLVALDTTFPDGESIFYYPGSPTNARLMFRKRLPGEWHPNGRSYVLVDPYTANVVQAIDARAQGAGTRAMHAVYPIHAAKTGGVAMVLFAAFAAAALTWMTVSGVWTYFGRRAKRTVRLKPDTTYEETVTPSGRTFRTSRLP